MSSRTEHRDRMLGDIAHHLESGYALSGNDIREFYIKYGYSPKSSPTFYSWHREQIDRMFGVNIRIRRISRGKGALSFYVDRKRDEEGTTDLEERRRELSFKPSVS